MKGLIIGLSCYFGQPCQLVVHLCDGPIGAANVAATPWLAFAVSPRCQWVKVPPTPLPINSEDVINAGR